MMRRLAVGWKKNLVVRREDDEVRARGLGEVARCTCIQHLFCLVWTLFMLSLTTRVCQ